MKVEICVDSAESAMAAEEGGADRVELCDNLMEGGTTPSAGAITVARKNIGIGLQVIIRPRGGDFLFSDVEMDVMCEDINMAKDLGANGIVIGCLTAEGEVDVTKVEEMIQLADPLNVTFHRAFDMCRDPFEAMETLIGLGVSRILTSGQESSCLEGLALLAQLNEKAGDRIIIMPGGGITPRNVARIVAGCEVSEVHLSARKTVESGMDFRNPNTFMGGALRPPEYSLKTTDAEAVRHVMGEVGR